MLSFEQQALESERASSFSFDSERRFRQLGRRLLALMKQPTIFCVISSMIATKKIPLKDILV